MLCDFQFCTHLWRPTRKPKSPVSGPVSPENMVDLKWLERTGCDKFTHKMLGLTQCCLKYLDKLQQFIHTVIGCQPQTQVLVRVNFATLWKQLVSDKPLSHQTLPWQSHGSCGALEDHIQPHLKQNDWDSSLSTLEWTQHAWHHSTYSSRQQSQLNVRKRQSKKHL